MIFHNHLRYAASIINQYDGSVPLAIHVKSFFKINKQMGSRDRKTVSEYVYGYYRLGHLKFNTIEERIQAGIDKNISGNGIFPFKHLLSEGIDADVFEQSFLIQPDLFIRIRPGKKKIVEDKLIAAGVDFYHCEENCLGMPNSTKVDSILELNKEAVIQDRSSQQTGELINNLFINSIWDCCAASGGKSLMAYDVIKNINLTVSDVRPSIINNLKERFSQAGINNYHSFVADLTDQNDKLPKTKYDLVIADVPCSGSGTWSRTPEQLYYFKEEKINHYQQLQQKIVSRVMPFIRPGGYLLYITCSVFKIENEDMLEFIRQNSSLQLINSQLIKGYTHKADTLFAALFMLEAS
jgi:16S rRNA (cytosine967-C5)-methyltransferase